MKHFSKIAQTKFRFPDAFWASFSCASRYLWVATSWCNWSLFLRSGTCIWAPKNLHFRRFVEPRVPRTGREWISWVCSKRSGPKSPIRGSWRRIIWRKFWELHFSYFYRKIFIREISGNLKKPIWELPKATQIRKKTIILKIVPYRIMPSLAVDLMDKMLILDPSRRITAADALNHPWFRSFDPSRVPPLKLPENQVDKLETKHIWKINQILKNRTRIHTSWYRIKALKRSRTTFAIVSKYQFDFEVRKKQSDKNEKYPGSKSLQFKIIQMQNDCVCRIVTKCGRSDRRRRGIECDRPPLRKMRTTPTIPVHIR